MKRSNRDVNQPHAPNPEALNLNTVVRALQAPLRRMVGEDVDLVRDLTPSLPPVRADRKDLDLVLAALVLNAREGLAPGCCITIETAAIPAPKPLVLTHGKVPPGMYVRLAVRSTGPARDPASYASWFAPVSNPTPESPTNPGMQYAHHLIRQNAGYLAVESRAGQWEEVFVYFPDASRK